MKIYVSTKFSVTVDPSDSIDRVKEKIQEVIGLAPAYQDLSANWFENSLLEDSTLSSLGIRDNEKISLTVLSSSPEINVRIMKDQDELVDLKVDSKITVAHLKTMIQETMGHPPDQQRLIFRGKLLKDSKTLDDYKLKNDYVIHLTLRPNIVE